VKVKSRVFTYIFSLYDVCFGTNGKAFEMHLSVLLFLNNQLCAVDMRAVKVSILKRKP